LHDDKSSVYRWNGTISTACSALAVEQGIELYLLNRGQTTDREAPKEARLLQADIRQPDSVRAALGELHFDCVVDWVAFTPEHIETDIQLFTGRTSQFIFISTAMVYHKPPAFYRSLNPPIEEILTRSTQATKLSAKIGLSKSFA